MSIDLSLESVSYGKRTVISSVEASLPDGSFTALIGRNGSGKSTLAAAILSIIPYKGDVKLDGISAVTVSPRERARLISGILQTPKAPHITVEELVSLGRNPHGSLLKPSDEDKFAVEAALLRAELSNLRTAYLDEISGGELKRAYFGMLLSQDTKNIVLDEATAFMDVDFESDFLALARSLAKNDEKTVLAVVHSLDMAVRYADNIMLLDGGKLSFYGSVSRAEEEGIIEKCFGVQRIAAGGTSFFYRP